MYSWGTAGSKSFISWNASWTSSFKQKLRELNTRIKRIDHVERKVPKYEYHKIRERKVKTLTRNWRDHCRTGTRKNTETVSKYFDRHGRLYQSEESKCLWTHEKMASLDSLWKVQPGGCERFIYLVFIFLIQLIIDWTRLAQVRQARDLEVRGSKSRSSYEFCSWIKL